MAELAGWLISRGHSVVMNSTKVDTGDYNTMSSLKMNEDNDGQANKQLINALQFAESKVVRTSTIILASFNILAAFVIATSILVDCYRASQRTTGERTRRLWIYNMHSAETFPLVLAVGIFVQGLVFAGSQSIGMQGLMADGCSTVSQLMFPAIFIVPYIQLVFGLECAIRGLRRNPFQPRGKYDVAICVGVIIVGLIATWIPSHIFPMPDHCFASLMWFVLRYGEKAFIIDTIIAGLLIVSTSIIFYRLTSTSMIEQNQRIAASRMVYYMVLGIVSLGLVIPWFATIMMGNPSLLTSMMATVVVNLSGILTLILQMFLRSNAVTTAIRPRGTPGWSRRAHVIRIFGPNDLGFGDHLNQPVSGPRSPGSIGSRMSLVRDEKERGVSMDSLRSPPGYMTSPKKVNPMTTSAVDQVSRLPTIPEPTVTSPSVTSPSRHARKPSYSLFPAADTPTSPVKPQLPSTSISNIKISPPMAKQPDEMTTFYESSSSKEREEVTSMYPEDLEPPPPIHYLDAPAPTRGHRRDSSMVSSATVQIGLRLSSPPDEEAPSLPATTYQAQKPATNLRIQTGQPSSGPRPVNILNMSRPFNRAAQMAVPGTLLPAAEIDRDARMKTLPPVPRGTNVSGASSPTGTKLSPTVYTPASAYKPAVSSPLKMGSPSRLQPPVDDIPDPRLRASKADWI